MFKLLQSKLARDKDYPERVARLQSLQQVLKGTLYDVLRHPFHDERNGAGEYIPLRERRPCVRSNICRIVVDDSVALLFSEGHFPSVELADGVQRAALARVLKEARFNEVMIDAATRGSVGSVALHFQVLGGRVFLKVLDTVMLTPVWQQGAPDTLARVVEKYKVNGEALRAASYAIGDDDLKAVFWFQRVFTAVAEEWYVPWKAADVGDGVKPRLDVERTVTHELGFVPIVWMRNLPGGDEIDGLPTFCEEAIDTQIEIDYQLSQAGRGLKYSSDPTLLIKEPAGSAGEPLVKGGANAIVVDEKGDAKLLEISGKASEAVLDYVKFLREMALETMHGNRAQPEKLSAAQSGRAMELMMQPLVWLADKLRISYGERGIAEVVSMILRASRTLPLSFKNGERVAPFEADQAVSLRWPRWFPPTAGDLAQIAATLCQLCAASLMSRETAIKVLAAQYDIDDTAAERALVEAEVEDGAQV